MKVLNKVVSTTSNNPVRTIDWDQIPSFYLNDMSEEKFGILTLNPKISKIADKLSRALPNMQSELTLTMSKSGKLMLMHERDFIGFINGDVDPESLLEALANSMIVFTRMNDAHTLESKLDKYL